MVVVVDPDLDLAQARGVAPDIAVAISKIPRLWLERPGPTVTARLWSIARTIGACHLALVHLEPGGVGNTVAVVPVDALGKVVLVSLTTLLGEQR